ncbi:hypothetical protein [Rhodococcus sp. IEGM 1379]|nr:hypothetical protein [Rhodococcus sp. IEGM 1379]
MPAVSFALRGLRSSMTVNFRAVVSTGGEEYVNDQLVRRLGY